MEHLIKEAKEMDANNHSHFQSAINLETAEHLTKFLVKLTEEVAARLDKMQQEIDALRR